jgi:DNA-binding NarL/FixJ family response regulator
MTGSEPIRVVVADDQELVRTGFCVILEATDGITVVAEAANGAEAVQAATEYHPDVILMDVRRPEMDGLEATRLITGGDRGGPPRVVMLTTFDFDDYVYEALRSGASGFLLKDAPRHDLIAAIKVAAAGNAQRAGVVERGDLGDHPAGSDPRAGCRRAPRGPPSSTRRYRAGRSAQRGARRRPGARTARRARRASWSRPRAGRVVRRRHRRTRCPERPDWH